jgi:tetratricopeptide (TPR) repeat protein
MSESARILRFPVRPEAAPLSPENAKRTAQGYLSLHLKERCESTIELVLVNPDALAAVCGLLREMLETSPSRVVEEADLLYSRIKSSGRELGLFDERDYFLGELALIAGSARRLVGDLLDADRWFDRADAGFRHTINPAPLLASLSYARLALRYESGRYGDVIELLPSLILSFRKLGMELEAAKCCFLEAKTLMQVGKPEQSLLILSSLRENQAARANHVLLSNVLIYAGNCFGSVGQYEEASKAYSDALPVVQEGGLSAALGQLKWSIGDTYKSQGQTAKAVEAYRSAQEDFATMLMPRYVALLHLVIAETILSLGYVRQAEWEILAALPTIEAQKMVPESFAAVALLKESVRLRKTDSNALRELREHLQAGK